MSCLDINLQALGLDYRVSGIVKNVEKQICESYSTLNNDRDLLYNYCYYYTIKSFFYTGIKQWNALPSATQLLSNKQAFKSEVKKLLWMKLFQLDEEIYPFY